MRIASQPILIPAYVPRKPEGDSRVAAEPTSITEIPALRGGAPVYRLAVGGFGPPSARGGKTAAEALRKISTMIADNCGRRIVKLGNAIVWIACDAVTLFRHSGDPTVSKGQRVVETTRLASEVAGVVGLISEAEVAKMAETTLSFAADLGEGYLHQGAITLNGFDLTAASLGGEAGEAFKLPSEALEWQKILEDLGAARLDSSTAGISRLLANG